MEYRRKKRAVINFRGSQDIMPKEKTLKEQEVSKDKRNC